jgi:hypothetical protein
MANDSNFERMAALMKKKLLAVSAVFLLGVLVLIMGISGDDPLDPAVDEALTFRFPDVPPEQNAHVDLSGLGDSQYGDVVRAGQKYLKDGYQDHNDSPDFDFSYPNPCVSSRENEGCLDQIVADGSIIDQAVQKNEKIWNATVSSSKCRYS